MTQFYFQQNAAAGGSGTISSPWDLAAFNAALASGGFRVGGADSLAILVGGTSTLTISAANANRTPITGVGGATTVQLNNTIFENSVNIDLTQITGINAIALTNSTGSGYFSVSTGSRLTLNAAQANALTITGFGSVAVSNLQSTPAADLSNIATSVFTASAALTADVTFTGSLGRAAVSLSSASGNRTFTVQTGTLTSTGGSISVGSGVTLASRNDVNAINNLSGVTATTTGTGTISLPSLSGTANLSGLTGNVVANVSADVTFTGNLGTIRPTVASGFRLTLADNSDTVANSTQFNGAGALTYIDTNGGSNGSTTTLNVFTTGANILTSNTVNRSKVINTGSGADSITTGNQSDTITSGAGNDTISAGNGNNVIRAGAGADSVTGGINNDYIEGGGGNDTINGGDGLNFITDSGGLDSISTGTGADTILSGSDNDTISSGDGADSIGAGSGSDSVVAGAGADTVVGGGGNDTINGGADIDSLSGGDGNDQFQVEGNGQQVAGDVISGGTGTNTVGFTGAAAVIAEFDFDNISDVLTINNAGDNLGQTRTITFSAIAETTAQTVVADLNNSTAAINVINNAASSTTIFNITGGSGADTLNGSNGADTLNGGSGNDTINAGAGVDSVSGGIGDDQILVAGTGQQVAADVIAGGSGTNTISFTGTAGVIAEFDFDNISDVLTLNNAGDNLGQNRSVTFSAIAETTAQTVVLDLGGVNFSTGVVNVTNNANSATTLFALTGGTAADVLVGSNGADTLTGGLSADNLSGGNGANSFRYGNAEFIAAETVTGGANVDTISFTVDAQTVADAAFTNKTLLEAITTANGVNSITLGTNAAAATANLTVTGGTGDDTIDASALGEAINIVGNAGNNTLTGTNQADTITALAGNDIITGGDLADNLSGGDGANTFRYGNAEFIAAETVTGGANVDTILFTVDGQTVADAAFANKTLLEAITTANGVNSITLGTAAAAASANLTVTGGTGVDTINATALGRAVTILAGGDADVVTGSNQADTITGGAGADQLNGGAGNDTFRYTTAATSVGAAGVNTDVITGFTSTADTIGLQQGAAGALLAGVTIAANSTAAAFAANVVDANAVTSLSDVYTAIANNVQFNIGNFAGSTGAAGANQLIAKTISFANGAAAGTYLVINDSTAAFQAANDLVIGLGTGVVAAAAGDIVTFA